MSAQETTSPAIADEIVEQREREERVRAEAETRIADEHRRSVKLWAEAFDDGHGYIDIGQWIGVTRAYVRKEVNKLKAGQL